MISRLHLHDGVELIKRLHMTSPISGRARFEDPDDKQRSNLC